MVSMICSSFCFQGRGYCLSFITYCSVLHSRTVSGMVQGLSLQRMKGHATEMDHNHRCRATNVRSISNSSFTCVCRQHSSAYLDHDENWSAVIKVCHSWMHFLKTTGKGGLWVNMIRYDSPASFLCRNRWQQCTKGQHVEKLLLIMSIGWKSRRRYSHKGGL